jgi:hypothetical protein
MPITLAEYATLPVYELGRNPIGTEVRGDQLEFWIKTLLPGTSRPTAVTISSEAIAAADATSISVSSSADITLYAGDVLKFGSKDPVVIATTTEVTSSATTVPVLPVIEALADGDTAKTYGMLPVLFRADGGVPETSGTDAGSRNAGESLYRVKAVVERDYTIPLNGRMVSTDPTLYIFRTIGTGRRNVFWQTRYAPFLSFTDDTGATLSEGAGPGAQQGVAYVQNFSMPHAANDLAMVNATLSGVGAPENYVILPNT